MRESVTRKAGRRGQLLPKLSAVSRNTFITRARLPGRSCMQLKITYDVRHPASQPCARWLAGRSHAFIQPASRARASCMKTLDALRSDHGWMDGWMDGWMHAPARARACIQPASRARACIMHAESGCTQIRSCTVCMPNLGGPGSLVAICMRYGP